MKNLHFVLKYKDILRSEAIEKHERVLNKYGAVWWGSLNQGISQNMVEEAVLNIKKGLSAELILICRGKPLYKASIIDARAASLQVNTIKTPSKTLTPKYYSFMKCPAWFLLADIQEVNDDYLNSFSLFLCPKLPVLRGAITSMAYVTHAD